MKAIYPMVGASSAACAQNLKSSSFTGAFSSGWTFASTGATPNGISAFMNTSLTPLSSLSQDNTHISAYSRTNIISEGALIGNENDLQPQLNIFPTFFSELYMRVNSVATSRIVANTSSLGLFLANRVSSTQTRNFQNSTLRIQSANSTGLSNVPIHLSRQGLNVNNFGPFQIAFSSIGNGLTDTQATNLYTAVQTFNQTLNRQVGPQLVSDTDAQAFINRVYNAGGTLSDTEANAVNQLTIDMKAAGIWDSMKAVYPMVGASAAACAQNLKSSSFTGTFTSGWTFASTGATPNGTSAYMDTFFNSSINGNLSDGFLGTYLRTNSVGTPSCDFGNYNGSDSAITIYARFNNTQLTRWNDINDTPLSTTDSRGFRFVSRTSSTVKKIGINSSITAVNTNSVALINSKIYLSCLSTNNSPSQYSNRECAFACIGDGLTDTQVVNFYNAIQTFNTTLSRQV